MIKEDFGEVKINGVRLQVEFSQTSEGELDELYIYAPDSEEDLTGVLSDEVLEEIEGKVNEALPDYNNNEPDTIEESEGLR